MYSQSYAESSQICITVIPLTKNLAHTHVHTCTYMYTCTCTYVWQCFDSWVPFRCGHALKVRGHTCANQRSSSNGTRLTITTTINCQMTYMYTPSYNYIHVHVHVHVRTCRVHDLLKIYRECEYWVHIVWWPPMTIIVIYPLTCQYPP